MTAVTGGPADETQVLRAVPGAARAHVPVPAPGTEVLGPHLGSGYVDPPALVRRGDGQILQLTPIVHAAGSEDRVHATGARSGSDPLRAGAAARLNVTHG